MNGVKPGDRVGVFWGDSVVYGRVKRKTKGCFLEVMMDDCFLKMFDDRDVFPVWKGTYTQKDVLELAEVLRDFDIRLIADDIRDLHHISGYYIPVVLTSLRGARDCLASDIGEEMESVKMIDRFLDWANHGFQSGVEQ